MPHNSIKAFKIYAGGFHYLLFCNELQQISTVAKWPGIDAQAIELSLCFKNCSNKR
jgi:hypothetical protein